MFEQRRRQLLGERCARQQQIDQGELPAFPAETAGIRQACWKIADTPANLQDRRVEIAGPTDRKMIINALNSGANVFMADFEDSNSPTWENILEGQVNLCDAVNGADRVREPYLDHPAQLHCKHRAGLRGEATVSRRDGLVAIRQRGWHHHIELKLAHRRKAGILNASRDAADFDRRHGHQRPPCVESMESHWLRNAGSQGAAMVSGWQSVVCPSCGVMVKFRPVAPAPAGAA